MASITWTGAAGDGNYNNPVNWSPQQVPGSADTVTISTPAATAIGITGTDAVAALTTNNKVSLSLSNSSTYTIGSGTGTATFANGGIFSLNSNYNNTDLVVGGAKLTLSGGGTILLNNYAADRIYGAVGTDVLVNSNNLIEGGGQLGAGQLTFTNAAAGTVNANDATQLVLNTGTATVTNSGLLEATAGSAGLVIQSSVNNGTLGRISAAGGTVFLASGASIAGGTLSSSGGAFIDDSNTATLNGATNAVTNLGSLVLANSTTLTVVGSLVNKGTVALQSNYNNTDLIVGSANVTLSGGGTIAMGDYPANRIYGAVAADTLTNVDNTIAGAGQLGASQLTLVNEAAGKIDATGTNALYLTAGTTSVVNAGLIEATGTGGLYIEAGVDGSTGGTILGAGGTVYLTGADLIGGTIKTSNVGTLTGAITVSGNSTLDGSAHAVINDTSIGMINNTTLTLLGTIANAGTIALNSNYNNTDLVVSSTGTVAGTVTLTGSGTIAMGDYPANRLYGAIAGDTLVNLNNTIAGAGQLGIGQLSLVNDATIDATGANVLYLNTSTPAINNALIESTGVGGLVIQSAVDSHGGGTILAAGSTVSLSGATLAGGLVTSSTVGTVVGAVIDTGGATLDGSAHTLTNTGVIDVNNGQVLTLVGTITNNGSIALNSTYNVTDLNIGTNVVLNGGGTLTLGDYGNANQIQGTSSTGTLDNIDNKIVGAGVIGEGTLTVINETAGIIDANTADNSIIIVGGMINHGLIEATAAGGLSIQTTIANTGTLLAAGANIYLNTAVIDGGLLKSTTVNTIAGAFVDNGGATLDGSAAALTNAATIDVVNGQQLTLIGTFTNHGVVALGSTYNVTNLDIGTDVVLTGGGSVLLGDYNNQNQIQGTSSTGTLDNLNNAISGAGVIGTGTLTFINEAAGVVNANTADSSIILEGTIVNHGLLEATGAGGLSVQTTIANTGTIAALGANVYLNGATIQGGTLVNSIVGTTTGAFVDNGGATLDGSAATVTNAAIIDVNNGQVLDLLGTITNQGTIALNSTYNSTDVVAGGAAVTLTGGGTVLLGNYNQQNRIYGATGATVLNNVNNTISGAGQIGAGQLTLNNEAGGTIDANVSGNQIILNDNAITNAGLIEATAGGSITLQTAVTNTGTLLANGGVIDLNGGSIAGGHLSSENGGSVVDLTGGTLDGSAHALTNTAAIGINNGQQLTLLGSIVNNGSISINSNYNTTDLIVGSPTVTLTGTGTITLGDYNEQDRFYGAAAADVLNNVGNTINGGGQLGAGQLTLINSGIIAATGANALIVNLGSTGTNTTAGQMLGIGAGGLAFQNGTYTNSGTIQADSGSSVTFQSGAILTNDSAAGVLTGGTYGAVSAGGTATASASFGGAAIASDNATLLLSGVGSLLSFGGVSLQSSLKSIGTKGSLSVLNGQAFSNAHGLTNNGSIALGGGTFTTKGLTNKGVVSGFGTLAGNVTDTGSIVATGGELTLTGKANSIAGTLSGSGTLAFKGVDTLNAGTVLNVAEIALINAATLNLAASVSFGGTFDIQGAASLAGPGGFTNTGLFEQTGHGLGSVSAPFTNSGTISVAAGGTLAFTGGLANTGSIIDNGVFTDSAALTGGNLTVGAASSSATLGAGSSTVSTLTLGGGALNTSGGTVTVTGDYNNTAAGVGNSYNPFAGVTGTINGQGTQLAVIGVNGTTITSVNGTLTISVAPGGSAHFEIENTGAAGSAALRGALQTTVNGGTINGTALTGSGVHAADFGPIAAGATSTVYTINDSGGSFSNEAIHLASDFANVAGLTIDIVQQGQVAASPALSLAHADVAHDPLAWLPMHHTS